MRLIAVANICEGKRTIGFRVLNINKRTTSDMTIPVVMELILGNVQIDNLIIRGGNIVGSNGSIERLPKLINWKLAGKSPLVIINQLSKTTYTVSDYKGIMREAEASDIVEYVKKHGIANGKIVTKNGYTFISSINGEYDIVQKEVELDVSNKEQNILENQLRNKVAEELVSDKELRFAGSIMSDDRI